MAGGHHTGQLSPEEAAGLIFEHTQSYEGRFYGPHAGLSVGVGLICAGILFPYYDAKRGIYVTVEGRVVVLTHECDVSQENQKAFNSDVLIGALVPFEEFLFRLQAVKSPQDVPGYLGDLATGGIYQLMYFPQLPPQFPYGAVFHLNRITFTDLSAFQSSRAVPLGALTGYGLNLLDYRLELHLRRAKAESLPGTWGWR